MFRKIRILTLVASFALLGGVPISASAQDLSESHLQAARDAVFLSDITVPFQVLLPRMAEQLKSSLIGSSPDERDKVNLLVDTHVLALEPRFRDLEADAARIFANNFSETELKEISTFFGSTVGRKYLDTNAIRAREVDHAAQRWALSVNRELRGNVLREW
jgi:hypothetical protein